MGTGGNVSAIREECRRLYQSGNRVAMFVPITTRASGTKAQRSHEAPFHDVRISHGWPLEWHFPAGKRIQLRRRNLEGVPHRHHGAARWGAKMRKTPILTGMATAAGLVAALGVVVAPAAGAQ